MKSLSYFMSDFCVMNCPEEEVS